MVRRIIVVQRTIMVRRTTSLCISVSNEKFFFGFVNLYSNVSRGFAKVYWISVSVSLVKKRSGSSVFSSRLQVFRFIFKTLFCRKKILISVGVKISIEKMKTIVLHWSQPCCSQNLLDETLSSSLQINLVFATFTSESFRYFRCRRFF